MGPVEHRTFILKKIKYSNICAILKGRYENKELTKKYDRSNSRSEGFLKELNEQVHKPKYPVQTLEKSLGDSRTTFKRKLS